MDNEMKEVRMRFSGISIIVVKGDEYYEITPSKKEGHSSIETDDGIKEIEVPFRSFFEEDPPISQIFFRANNIYC